MKTKLTIVYKVVTPALKSCCASRWYLNPEDWSVQYKLNEFVRPKVKNSKLFVFCDLQTAKDFMSDYSYIVARRIYKCEALNATKCLLIGDSVRTILEFWKYRGVVRKLKTSTKTPPEGTLQADAIKLLERVD
jgi:hypothetical protein